MTLMLQSVSLSRESSEWEVERIVRWKRSQKINLVFFMVYKNHEINFSISVMGNIHLK